MDAWRCSRKAGLALIGNMRGWATVNREMPPACFLVGLRKEQLHHDTFTIGPRSAPSATARTRRGRLL